MHCTRSINVRGVPRGVLARPPTNAPTNAPTHQVYSLRGTASRTGKWTGSARSPSLR